MFEKIYLTFNFKSKVSCDIKKTKTKNYRQNWHLHFLLHCHLNVTCLAIRVKSIYNFSINLTNKHFIHIGPLRGSKFLLFSLSLNQCVVVFFTIRSRCQFLDCVSQLTCINLLCKFVCVKCQKLCQWNTLVRMYLVWTIQAGKQR